MEVVWVAASFTHWTNLPRYEGRNSALQGAFCGEEQINEDEDGNTHCISGCYNTDIISWEDYCERDSDAIEWASEQAILQMQEEYGDKYSSLIYEEDNVISYTEDGQEIYDELFGEYYQDYMRDRS